MRLTLVEPPAIEPISAAEAKSMLNIGSEVSDDVMEVFITAARQQIDGPNGWLGRALITQTWQESLDEFPCGKINIPLAPLQEVSSVSYIGSDGSSVEMGTDLYQVGLGSQPYIVAAYGSTWPTIQCRTDAVTIEFTAGYGDDPTDVPQNIRLAIALMAGQFRSMSARNLFISAETVDGVGSKNYVVGGNAQFAIDGAVASLLAGYRVFA